MKRKTHVALVLDRSYSMDNRMEEAISGYNEQVQILKEQLKNGEDVDVSLITFDGNTYEHLWCESPDKLVEASVSDYKLGSWTAMRDAVGFTVKKLLDTTNHEDENTSYLVIVISDGDSNKDEIFKGPDGISALREMIMGVQATKKWTFTYMGCGTQYMEQISRETAVPLANMATWSNKTKEHATRGIKGLSVRSAQYWDARSKGESSVTNYMSDISNKVASFDDADADALECSYSKTPFTPVVSGNIGCGSPSAQVSSPVETTSGPIKPIKWEYKVDPTEDQNLKTVFANAKRVFVKKDHT